MGYILSRNGLSNIPGTIHRFKEALRVWDGLFNKGRPVHKALRADALRGLLAAGRAGANRESMERELTQLNADLVGQKGWLALDWD